MKSQNFAYNLSHAIRITAAIFGLFLLQTGAFSKPSVAQEDATYQASDLEAVEPAKLPQTNDGEPEIPGLGGGLNDTESQPLFPDTVVTTPNNQSPVWAGFSVGVSKIYVCELDQAALCLHIPLN